MLEYSINLDGDIAEISGPYSSVLHPRLLLIPGTKFNRDKKVWLVPKCKVHIAEIVIKYHLNNLSKKDPVFNPELKAKE